MKIKIILSTIALALCACLTACTSAQADGGKQGTIEHNIDIVVTEGYYTSDKSDFYIEVKGNQVCLRNYDYISVLTEAYDNIDEADIGLDEFIENSYQYKDLTELQEFVPIRAIGMGRDGKDLVMLVWNYEFAKEKGTYHGIVYVNEKTLEWGSESEQFTYYGTTAPSTEKYEEFQASLG